MEEKFSIYLNRRVFVMAIKSLVNGMTFDLMLAMPLNVS